MKVCKDKNYYKVYLSCVIMDGLLSVGVIILCIFSILSMIKIGFSLSVFMLMILLLVIVIFANVLAWKSLLGYLKTPDIVLEQIDDRLNFTPDGYKRIVSLKKNEITKIDLVRPMICRSGKRIVIFTENDAYHLEDIHQIEESFNKLDEWYNKL